MHIGGTDFDQRLNLALAMPLLGLGHTGPHGREVPSHVFHDLATWHLIHWQYGGPAVRAAQALRGDYRDPALHRLLMAVLERQFGHRIAAEVERAKIAASSADAQAWLDLDFIEPALGAPLPPGPLAGHLQALLARVAACAQDCVRRAGVAAGALDAVYLTGGSSALRPFQATLRTALPGVPLVEGDLFGGVAAGLAVTAALV
ncbi:MAG: hypothetical protein GAK38_01012 [Xylophilus sp.]|nr:MAG: hypothetical protein GAK38_01012 [Xylophilus sp.]